HHHHAVGRQVGRGVAELPAAGDDAELDHPGAHPHRPGNDGVPRLVVGDDLQLLWGEHVALARWAGDDPVHRLVEVGLDERGPTPANGDQGGLVDDVGQSRPGEAGRLLGGPAKVDVFQVAFAAVDLQDCHPAIDVG